MKSQSTRLLKNWHLSFVCILTKFGKSVLTPDTRAVQICHGKRGGFWTGTKRFNASHFINENGVIESFSGELHDWKKFPSSVQLERKHTTLRTRTSLFQSNKTAPSRHSMFYRIATMDLIPTTVYVSEVTIKLWRKSTLHIEAVLIL